MNQRWHKRLGSWRSPDEIINPLEYEVVSCPVDSIPRTFIEEHHYSGSYPAARERFLLYRRSKLVGAAVFSHPPNEAVLKRLPCERMAGIELGRLVLLDSPPGRPDEGVPGNGESWFVARCFELLRKEGIAVVVSCSDPVPRTTDDGRIVMPGHVGNVYQALNATYTGRTEARYQWFLPNGTLFSRRGISKIKGRERGYLARIEHLVRCGARRPLDLGEELSAWIDGELARLGTYRKHRGNHRYVWALDKRLRKAIDALALRTRDASGELVRSPYPKRIDEAA